MENIEQQETLLAKIGQASQARLAELSGEEYAKHSYLRACEIAGMVELLKLLPGYQGMIKDLRKHLHWLAEQSEGR